MGDGDEVFLLYVMTSCPLISTILRTNVSNGFDWLTRLFCSFPHHDTTLTVSLRMRERMWTQLTEVSKI